MSRYAVEFRPAATRDLKRLDRDVAERVRGAVALLAVDPRPPQARALRGRPGYRLRLGDYRVIYNIDDDVLVVVVVRLGHRRQVYDR